MPKSKDKIRAYVAALRECVEKANISDKKRVILLEKIHHFEKELDKKRLHLLEVTLVTIELLALPGALWASAQVTHRLIRNVMQTVAEAKAAEEESQAKQVVAPLKAISPPRAVNSSPPTQGGGLLDMDDDVPF